MNGTGAASGYLPPPVGLADLLRAVDVLGPDEAARQLFDGLLLGPRREPAPPRPLPTPAPDLPGDLVLVQADVHPGERSDVPAAPSADDVPVAVRTLELPPLQAPEPLREGRSVAEILGREPPPRPAPTLLPPLIESAILRAFAGTTRPGEDLDERKAVAALAHGRVLTDLPRRPIHTTGRGLQLLLDQGAAMDPYRDDAKRLTTRMARVVPAGQLAEVWFADCPMGTGRSVIGRSGGERPYALPPAGTPILAVTAFGRRGRSASPDRAVLAGWRDLLASARRAGHPLVILTPYPDTALPGPRGSASTMVSWGGDLTIRQALAAVRAASRSVPASSNVPRP